MPKFAAELSAPPHRKLTTAIVRARSWAQRLTTGEIGSIAEIAAEEKISAGHVSENLRLAYHAPWIVEGILSGESSPDLLA